MTRQENLEYNVYLLQRHQCLLRHLQSLYHPELDQLSPHLLLVAKTLKQKEQKSKNHKEDYIPSQVLTGFQIEEMEREER